MASRIIELSARPVESDLENLWRRHNALEDVRPLIFCDPENGWNEIVRPEDLICDGSLAREWEMVLRKELFWGSRMGDDRVTMRAMPVPYIYSKTDWGMHETRIGGDNGGSYVWDAPLKDYNNIDMVVPPVITVDYTATERLLTLASETFDGILDVTLTGSWWWTLGMTWTLVNLRGLEQIMYDVYDHPNELHALMARLRDGHLEMLDFLEMHGLLSLNNDGTYVGSGGFGWTDELPSDGFDGKRVRTRDMWGFAESQETTVWSPDMFEEFVFPYQYPILGRFGLNCYGCCEPLEKRWSDVSRIPRLRRVSVSPWASLEDMAEKLGNQYILSYKPNPAVLAMPVADEDQIRQNIRRALNITKDCRVEIIMKDNHTIGNNPENVITWCRIAKEEIAHM